MENSAQEKLLNDKRVVDEIRRHLWIESEKAGYDIGFDKAREDWLKKFSKAWLEYNLPEELSRAKNSSFNNASPVSEKVPAPAKVKVVQAKSIKRRRAKSYIL